MHQPVSHQFSRSSPTDEGAYPALTGEEQSCKVRGQQVATWGQRTQRNRFFQSTPISDRGTCEIYGRLCEKQQEQQCRGFDDFVWGSERERAHICFKSRWKSGCCSEHSTCFWNLGLIKCNVQIAPSSIRNSRICCRGRGKKLNS